MESDRPLSLVPKEVSTAPDEFEITQAMIEAGEDAIWLDLRCTSVDADFSARDLAVSVYRAMRSKEVRG
jgi:hypothetical protein